MTPTSVITPYGPGEIVDKFDEHGYYLVLVPRDTMNPNWKDRFKGKYPRLRVHESEMEYQHDCQAR